MHNSNDISPWIMETNSRSSCFHLQSNGSGLNIQHNINNNNNNIDQTARNTRFVRHSAKMNIFAWSMSLIENTHALLTTAPFVELNAHPIMPTSSLPRRGWYTLTSSLSDRSFLSGFPNALSRVHYRVLYICLGATSSGSRGAVETFKVSGFWG